MKSDSNFGPLTYDIYNPRAIHPSYRDRTLGLRRGTKGRAGARTFGGYLISYEVWIGGGATNLGGCKIIRDTGTPRGSWPNRGLPSHTPQSQENRGLVHLCTLSCSST